MALAFFQYSPEARLGSVSGTQYIPSTTLPQGGSLDFKNE